MNAMVIETPKREIHGNNNEVIELEVPEEAITKTDEEGYPYLSIPHHVVIGIVEYRLYGLEKGQLKIARGKLVRALVCSIFTDAQMKSRKLRVKLQFAPVLQFTHKMIVHGRRRLFVPQVKTLYDYKVPGTKGVLEIQSV